MTYPTPAEVKEKFAKIIFQFAGLCWVCGHLPSKVAREIQNDSLGECTGQMLNYANTYKYLRRSRQVPDGVR